jgi:hypothetical protein
VTPNNSIDSNEKRVLTGSNTFSRNAPKNVLSFLKISFSYIVAPDGSLCYLMRIDYTRMISL